MTGFPDFNSFNQKLSCRAVFEMKSYQDCISHPFNPDQKENEWNVR